MTRYRKLYLTLLNKYWVDDIYDWLFVKPIKFLSTYLLWRFLDVIVVDGTVNGTAKLMRGGGGVLRRLQSGYIRSYGAWILLGAVLVVGYITFW
jgi:NADH-quinone oxidoreductase subunit L